MAARTIAVFDDEETQREALAGHLRNQGFAVLTAANGREGVELLRHNMVDLVLTDYRMPELDGIGVLQEARRLNPEIEVVLLTAYSSVGNAVVTPPA